MPVDPAAGLDGVARRVERAAPEIDAAAREGLIVGLGASELPVGGFRMNP